MTTEEAIVLLKRKRQEIADKQKTTPVSDLFNKLNLSLVNFISDIAVIFANKISKAEVVNQVDVKVSNFPKPTQVDLNPVIKAIKEIPEDKEVDLTPVVNAVKSIPQAKQVDLAPVVRAIKELPAPDRVDLQPVINAIKSLPSALSQPDTIKIKNQIDLGIVESLLSQLLKASDKKEEGKKGKEKEMFHKQLIEELKNQFAVLIEAVSENAAPSAVKVLNPGDFPVSAGIASYKKADGTIGYGSVDANGHVQVDVLTVPSGLATEAKQDTQIGQVNDLTHINTHTGESELRVYSEGHVCTQNSTNTPLGINGVFTGDWQDTLNYSEVIVSVYTDKSSITNGLVIQWSADGVGIHGDDVFTISASSGKTFSFPCQNRYVRVVYTNDGVAQTYFTLQTLLKRFASKGSSHRLKDALSQEDDAIVTKTLIAGKTTAAGTSIVDVKVNPSGALTVDASNSIVGIAPLPAIFNGSKTCPTVTAEAISTTQTINSVTIKSLSTNTGIVYVGTSGVTTSTGFELLAGESVSLDVDNLTDVYVIGSASSQVIRYIAV